MTRTHCKNFCGRATACLGWRGSACLCLAWFSTWLVTAAAGEGKPDGNKGFLENGSFEAIQRLAAPPKGNDFGTWVLKSDLQAPTAWTLNAAFPGALEVAEGGAADGKRFLRLAAGANRAAHLIQSCPQLRPGLTYKVTLRYRGGPVELKVYEYDAQNKLKTDRPFAEGMATPVRNGAWATLEGVYGLPEGIAKATLVVSCAGPQRSGPGRRARRAVRQAGDGGRCPCLRRQRLGVRNHGGDRRRIEPRRARGRRRFPGGAAGGGVQVQPPRVRSAHLGNGKGLGRELVAGSAAGRGARLRRQPRQLDRVHAGLRRHHAAHLPLE